MATAQRRPIFKSNRHLFAAPPRQFCGFCRTNGEMAERYLDHTTKDHNGKVTCPRLRAHICELCGATGDEAHTRSYCEWARIGRTDPFYKEMLGSIEGKPITFNNMVVLKKSRVNSAGKVRRR